MSLLRVIPIWTAVPGVNGKYGPTSGHSVLASVTLTYWIKEQRLTLCKKTQN